MSFFIFIAGQHSFRILEMNITESTLQEVKDAFESLKVKFLLKSGNSRADLALCQTDEANLNVAVMVEIADLTQGALQDASRILLHQDILRDVLLP